jgi:hypothetical protein
MKWFFLSLAVLLSSCANVPKPAHIGMAEADWKKKNPFHILAAAESRATVYKSGTYYYYFVNGKLSRIDTGVSATAPQVHIQQGA